MRMSGIILLIVTCFCLLFTPSYAYIPGDANSDSKITLADAIYLVNFIFRSGHPPVPSEAGDVNATCNVTLSDVIGLVNYIFKGIPIQGCPAWGEAVNLGSPPNSSNAEFSPAIAGNGLIIYFTKSTPPSGLDDIFYSVWNGAGWSEPVQVNSNVNSLNSEWEVSVSSDNRKLFFSSYGRPGGFGGFDIWMSEWDTSTDDWGPASNLGPNINTAGWDRDPSISADGKNLYFVSDSLGIDPGIFVSKWNGNSWGTAVRLSQNVNIDVTAEGPSISADGLTLYFTLHFIPGRQIYVSYWNGLDWTLGVPLIEANQGGTASGPQISTDGRSLYFSSNRSGGIDGSDIWIIRR